jgi:hypothetical protein
MGYQGSRDPPPAALPPADRERLIKLLGILGSDFDGEVAAAGRKAAEFLRQRKLTWENVLSAQSLATTPAPPPRRETRRDNNCLSDWPTHWLGALAVCIRHSADDRVTDWERSFIGSLNRQGGRRPSDRQLSILRHITEKVMS